MAVGAAERAQIGKLVRFGLTTPNAARLAAFYESGCGFRRLATKRMAGAQFASLMGVAGGARSVTLGLGAEVVELLEFDRPGKPYPQQFAASDLAFQHFAIVVADMGAAYQRLSKIGGWTAISSNGPQQLPASSGGVSAFKFRDPDGHPLELLAFAHGKVPLRWQADANGEVFLGIDHSAISVRDSNRSIAFYKELGLTVAARSRNSGPEQGRLDGLPDPCVEVIALAPTRATPHIELLCYRSIAHAQAAALHSNDIAATRLELQTSDVLAAANGNTQRLVLDPDGHHLLIEPTVNSSSIGAAARSA
jgi:catechol 2,3-dioxygenase-like lactoylglutathione lyase family enzyme